MVWQATDTLGYPFGHFFKLGPRNRTATRKKSPNCGGLILVKVQPNPGDAAQRANQGEPRACRAPVGVAMQIPRGMPQLGTYVFTSRRDRD